ncbi:MAG: TetR family transcriptional regulator [Acidobacteria bacterium]|nr:MAG: TetR family transcriptional regulator [Acidobacteriota bacterium]
MPQANLDRQTVVRAALRLLDRAGLDGLTVRKLAGELGVQAPALYWHFKNKEELLDEMATTVFLDAVRDSGWPRPDASWPEWAAQFGKRLRAMLLRYRDGARMFSGRYLTDSSFYGSMEVALRKLSDAGFSLRDATQGLNTIYCYAIGFAIEEQAVYPRPGKRRKRYELAQRAKRVDRKRFPLAAAAGEYTFLDFDKHFEQGLRLIVKGLQHSE